MPLIICILRNATRAPRADGSLTEFDKHSDFALQRSRNPLPNWERLQLVSLALKSDPILNDMVTPILRSPADAGWEQSIVDLPQNRLWAFNLGDEVEFATSKFTHYRSMGEKAVEVNYPRTLGFDGSKIREGVTKGRKDLEFLPDACHPYFAEQCLGYFGGTK